MMEREIVATSAGKMDELNRLDEEFNNFLHRVNEVDGIVKKLASTDRHVQEIGEAEARRYLGGESTTVEDVDQVALKVTHNRTVVNKKALMKEAQPKGEMSQEAFMEEVSRDAERRYRDRQIRREKMETFKKQASLAFNRGEYEKALTLYTKAIEQVKDSVLLYNNRALTYMKLGLLDKAENDLKDWALRLNEDCLKSWLLLMKIHFLRGDQKALEACVREAKERNPGGANFIDEYLRCWSEEPEPTQ